MLLLNWTILISDSSLTCIYRIDRVSSAKFLGVCLTNKLSWNVHVDNHARKPVKSSVLSTDHSTQHRLTSASSSTLLLSVRHLWRMSPNPFKPHRKPDLRYLNSHAVSIPFHRLTLTQRFFYPYSSSLWNYLPEVIVNAPTLQSFKSVVKTNLL